MVFNYRVISTIGGTFLSDFITAINQITNGPMTGAVLIMILMSIMLISNNYVLQFIASCMQIHMKLIYILIAGAHFAYIVNTWINKIVLCQNNNNDDSKVDINIRNNSTKVIQIKEFINDDSNPNPPGLLFALQWFLHDKDEHFANKNK